MSDPTSSDAVAVTERLDQRWQNALSLARRPWGHLSPTERVMVLVSARAGSSPVARFTPGELGRLVGITEDECHEAIEALIHAQRLGAESHPGAQIVLANLPEYQPPPPEPAPLPEGMRAVRHTWRGRVTWRLERDR